MYDYMHKALVSHSSQKACNYLKIDHSHTAYVFITMSMSAEYCANFLLNFYCICFTYHSSTVFWEALTIHKCIEELTIYNIPVNELWSIQVIQA